MQAQTQVKLDSIVSSLNHLNTELQVFKGTIEAGQTFMEERLGRVEEKIDDLQQYVSDQVIKNNVDIATLKVSMTAAEKYGPGAASGAAVSAAILGIFKLLTELVGGN